MNLLLPGLYPQPPAGFIRLETIAIDRSLAGWIRLRLAGPALAEFAACRPGAWVRVFIPGPQGDQGRAYSVCSIDRQLGQLELQIVRRRYGGECSDWLLEQLKLGDPLDVIGPRGGAEPLQDVDWHLMLGDETAVAAMLSRMQQLPASMPTQVYAEVPLPASAYPSDLNIHWLPRAGRDPQQASRLWALLQSLPKPQGRGEIWMAGERRLVRDLEQWCRAHWTDAELIIKAVAYWQAPAAAPVA